MTLKFGKYNGRDLKEVPIEYLDWLIETYRKSLSEFEAESERREQAELASQSMAQKVIEAGFRSLSKQLHPDHGGSDDDMRELLATRAHLRSLL